MRGRKRSPSADAKTDALREANRRAYQKRKGLTIEDRKSTGIARLSRKCKTCHGTGYVSAPMTATDCDVRTCKACRGTGREKLKTS